MEGNILIRCKPEYCCWQTIPAFLQWIPGQGWQAVQPNISDWGKTGWENQPALRQADAQRLVNGHLWQDARQGVRQLGPVRSGRPNHQDVMFKNCCISRGSG